MFPARPKSRVHPQNGHAPDLTARLKALTFSCRGCLQENGRANPLRFRSLLKLRTERLAEKLMDAAVRGAVTSRRADEILEQK